MLDGWMDDLEEEARRVAEVFQQAMYDSRGGSPKSWFKYGVRLERAPVPSRPLYIRWLEMEWSKKKDGSHKYRGRHVRKGPNANRYPARSFKPSSELERNYIENAEDEFEKIREQVKLIGSLRKVMQASMRKKARKEEE
nr:conjugative transfer protein MobI(A/C) [Ectothiorhodospira haloalkaliphila]